MSRVHRTGLVAALLAAALAFASGCGAPDDETAPQVVRTSVAPLLPSHLPTLPTGHGAVRPGDRVRAEGAYLVVRGRRIALAPLRADVVAVVPGGVFFLDSHELWFTDLSRARPTDYADVSSLVASADGRELGFLDLAHGPKDAGGTPLIMAVAYDTRTGRALASTYQGMGDLARGNLGHLYAAGRAAVLGFADGVMLLRGADGKRYRVPLAAAG